MTPETQLSRVVSALTALGVQPISVWADGPNDNLRIFVKVRTQQDLDAAAALGNGWRLSLPKEAA